MMSAGLHRASQPSRGDWENFGARWFGEWASVRNIWNLALLDPPFDALDVSTLVECIKVVERYGRSADPHMRNEAHINVAHDTLP